MTSLESASQFSWLRVDVNLILPRAACPRARAATYHFGRGGLNDVILSLFLVCWEGTHYVFLLCLQSSVFLSALVQTWLCRSSFCLSFHLPQMPPFQLATVYSLGHPSTPSVYAWPGTSYWAGGLSPTKGWNFGILCSGEKQFRKRIKLARVLPHFSF